MTSLLFLAANATISASSGLRPFNISGGGGSGAGGMAVRWLESSPLTSRSATGCVVTTEGPVDCAGRSVVVASQLTPLIGCSDETLDVMDPASSDAPLGTAGLGWVGTGRSRTADQKNGAQVSEHWHSPREAQYQRPARAVQVRAAAAAAMPAQPSARGWGCRATLW